MLSKFGKISLLLTALAPILPMYGATKLESEYRTFLIMCAITAALVSICLLILFFSKRRLERHEVQIRSVRNADQETIAFIVTYMLPFATESITSVNKVAALITLLFLGLAVFGSNAYHFNPLLRIFGYHFYEITDDESMTYIILTRSRIRSLGKGRKVVELSDYMLLDVT